MPALMIAGAVPAAAAPPKTPEPGTVVVHKTSPVVQYRLHTSDPEQQTQDDGGTVAVHYTCYPSLTDEQPETMELFVSLGYGEHGGFQNDRYGAQVPCDGERHRVETHVNRWTNSPFAPDGRRVTGIVSVRAQDCIFCPSPIITEYTESVKITFLGW